MWIEHENPSGNRICINIQIIDTILLEDDIIKFFIGRESTDFDYETPESAEIAYQSIKDMIKPVQV